MLGNNMLYYRITGYDNLKFFCKIYKVNNYKEKIQQITKEFGIQNWLGEYVGKYSSGMKMKLALCKTLLLDRKILLLDEPTLGLDVTSVDFVVNKLKNLNKTILICSHAMNVVEKLCDRVAFINDGKILKIGNQEQLKILYNNEIHINIHVPNNISKIKSDLSKQDYIINLENNQSYLKVVLNKRKNFSKLINLLANYNIISLSEKKLTLEELFIKLID